MAIDRTAETVIPITEASPHFPGKPHIATIWRWSLRGVRGAFLETLVVGGRRFTSVEAIERFIARTNAVAAGPSVPAQSPKQRQRQLAAADAVLARAGIWRTKKPALERGQGETHGAP
jgi:hypothetical protein